MKATELRIGNSIIINGTVIDEIGYSVIMDFYLKQKGIKTDYLNLLTFDPIPLTKEWTDRIPQKQIDALKNFGVLVIDYLGHRRQFEIAGIGYNVVYDYVHQIQNLFQGLVGEELTFKT